MLTTVNLIDNARKVISENRWSFLLSSLLLLLGTMNVLLIRQNLKLRSALEENAPQRLKTGDIVPPFTAAELEGGSINVKYGDESPNRVLLFFSPRCRYCASQFESWVPIIQKASTSKTQVLLLTMDSEQKSEIESFLQTVKCPPQSEGFRVALVPKTVRERYKISVTPTTVVVSNEGKIQNVWNGLAKAEDLADTYLSLGLSVPSN